MASMDNISKRTDLDDFTACFFKKAVDPDWYELGKDGEKIPRSMFEIVEHRMLLHRTMRVARDVSAIFECSADPIHKTIAKVKQEWAAIHKKTRAERQAEYASQFDNIHEVALAMGKVNAAAGAIKAKAKILGDENPDIHIMLNGDKPAADILKQAAELHALADEQIDMDEREDK